MSIFKSIEQAMIAASFAEAGEHDYARSCLLPKKNAHKRVLLGTDAQALTPSAISYAMGLCKRVGASLEVFHLISPDAMRWSAREFVAVGMEHLSALKEKLHSFGIEYGYTVQEGPLLEVMAKLLAKRRDILLVVLASDVQNCSQAEEAIINQFKCPVVLVGT